MKIGNYTINENSPVFIIAELSANHNGNIEVALETVKLAKKCGANAIKLQTYKPETMTIDCDKQDFIIKGGTIWDNQKLYDLYGQAFTPWEWHKEIFDLAKELDLICFSSPFDKSAVDFLEDLNVPAYKIASFEITDLELIKYVALKNKPIILSTGIASKEDIKLAVETCRQNGNTEIALLKCTSSYPAPINEANLLSMQSFKSDFNAVVGLSDHTMGDIVPITATALGAKIIEKHFIIDRNIGGPDASFSLNKEEFRRMVDNVRQAELAIGDKNYPVTEKMKKGRDFSRSIYAIKDIKEGDIFTEENVKVIRPGFGLHPKYYNMIIGNSSKKNYTFGDRISNKEIL